MLLGKGAAVVAESLGKRLFISESELDDELLVRVALELGDIFASVLDVDDSASTNKEDADETDESAEGIVISIALFGFTCLPSTIKRKSSRSVGVFVDVELWDSEFN